jgi:hypothetical protein
MREQVTSRKASMGRIAILVAMGILASHAAAIERHDVSQMAGEAVGRALQTERRSILRYPSARVERLILYDIYVRDHRDGLYRVLRCTNVSRSSSRL